MRKAHGVLPNILFFALLSWAMLLQGCDSLISKYDAGAFQYFTSLKAYHMKLLQDYTAGEGKTFDEAKLKSACDAGELRFREATEYAVGTKDKHRVEAFNLVHNQFSRDCKTALDDRKLFSPAFAKAEADNAAQNYDLAIEGERSRLGAPKL